VQADAQPALQKGIDEVDAALKSAIDAYAST
jgi:hypothetical protein